MPKGRTSVWRSLLCVLASGGGLFPQVVNAVDIAALEAHDARAALEFELAIATSQAASPLETDPAEPQTTGTMPPVFQVIDLRLALAQLAQTSGTNDQLTVLRAQPDGQMRALALISGAANDLDLSMALDTHGLARTDAAVSLPIVVFQGATLHLGPGSNLTLRRESGTFLLSFGALRIDGAEVRATGPASTTAPDFRPFVTIAGSGVLTADGAVFRDLGFGETPAFSGLSVMSGTFFAAADASRISNSIATNLVSVNLRHSKDTQVDSNLLTGMRGTALILRGTTGARVTGNRFADLPAGDGIRVSHGAIQTLVQGNQVYQAATGIAVVGPASGVTLAGNLIWRSANSGIMLRNVDCAIVSRNTLLRSRNAGVQLRATRAAKVLKNTIFGGRSAGLLVADQPRGTVTRIANNIFAANKTGLTTAAAERLILVGNDFTTQFPRFLQGDLSSLTPRLIADLSGRREIILTGGAALTLGGPSPHCDQQKAN